MREVLRFVERNLIIKIKFSTNITILTIDPIDKMNKVLDGFGITGVKTTEAMGVTYSSFKNKLNPNNDAYSFNEKNYQDIILIH